MATAFLSVSAGAQTPPAPRSTATAVRRDGAILIDGKLDEGAWQKAPMSNQFTQSYPNVGRPDTMTQVRVLYDDVYRIVTALPDHPETLVLLRSRLYQGTWTMKFNVHDRTAALAEALRRGIIHIR